MINDRYNDPRLQLARARSVKGMIRYATLLRGGAYVNRMLADLEVPPSLFDDTDGFVSPLLGDDILLRLRRDGFTEFQVRQMGTLTLLTNHPHDIGKIFSRMDTPAQLYEQMHKTHIDRFDHIWSYELTKLDDNGCVVDIKPRESAMELFGSSCPGSRNICVFRQGVYASLVGNIRKRLARVSESSCLFHGDPRCRYYVTWN